MSFNTSNHGFERARISEHEADLAQATARAELQSRVHGEEAERAPGLMGRIASRLRGLLGGQAGS
jgi:hypothetical protein